MDDHDLASEDQHYIRVPSAPADDRTCVLKHGNTFAVFDRHGDVHQSGLGEQGIYHDDTRHLSLLELALGREGPLLLSSTVNEANDVLAVDLTNPDIALPETGAIALPRGTLHVRRTKFIWNGTCHERILFTNYGPRRACFSASLRFACDFADVFEVRGHARPARGRYFAPRLSRDRCTMAYMGLDAIVRRTTIVLDPAPDVLAAGSARYAFAIEPHGQAELLVAVSCNDEPQDLATIFVEARRSLDERMGAMRSRQARILTSNAQLNSWIDRSTADLLMMESDTAEGPYPCAGVPWYSTPFGRDGIITALQLLWCDPGLARGVLGFLAAHQAAEVIEEQDAEPGKILHELRDCEMARLGEVPFGRYYGSVDATPLFVVLAGAHLRRTADRAFTEVLWRHVAAALAWMDGHGDPDGDGLLEYRRRGSLGLVHQGWKDSSDAVFHEDGSPAEAPIALCEVQGYAYAARVAAAEMASALGLDAEARAQRLRARELKRRFEALFWSDRLSTYVMALDGHKRPCAVRSSNAGHCLYTRIAAPSRAARVARTLLAPGSFSGWGIRTIDEREARYNPMSYHNGSVWPHDNALCAQGFGYYGLKQEVLRIFEALFEAAGYCDGQRLPELYCGFPQRPGQGPTLYPVACMPQAWASGSPFMLLRASLGLTIDAAHREIRFQKAVLPRFVEWVRIQGLEVVGATVDVLLERHEKGVVIKVLRREGDVRIVSVY